MNISVTVRRNIDDDNFLDCESNIYEEFLICALFSRTISAVNESISMPLRVTILCELLVAECIELRNGKVLSRQATPGDKVLQEVHKKVGIRPLPVNKLLTALNGESFNVRNFPIHIKNLRSKVIKQIIDKNLISKKKKDSSLLEDAVRKVYTQFNVGNFIVTQEVKETCVNKIW
ncbi:MAG: GPP34 family phosphoprotein, partial [Turicibacter sp.]